MSDPVETQRPQRRPEEQAAVALILGLVLLMPPVANIFSLEHKVFGVPFALVYVFVVWAGLILIGIRMSRRLMQHDQSREQDRPGSGPPGTR